MIQLKLIIFQKAYERHTGLLIATYSFIIYNVSIQIILTILRQLI